MFLSVKERAMQIANGQFQAPANPVTTDQVAPPTVASKVVPSKIVTTKYSPSKVSSSKTAPPPSTPSKSASRKTTSPKIEAPAAVAPPKTPTPKSPTLKSSSSKTPSSKTPSAKASSSKTSSSKTTTRKTSSSRSSSPKTSSSKTSKSSSPKIASPKIASPKIAPSKPVRPKVLSEMRIGSFAADPAEDNTEISELKAACLKQASAVTGLGGRHLAIVLKQSSSSGEWYAALKDLSSDKYLKMWMNRSKTFPTQVEALEAYLVFVKKMKMGCRLFPPMSPKAGKSRHD